jgi:hypothetical protein
MLCTYLRSLNKETWGQGFCPAAGLPPGVLLLAAVLLCYMPPAQSAPPASPDLAGVYQSIPNGTILPAGRRNQGSPAEISMLPEAAARMKTINPKQDPAKICQVIGPFRMMARDETRIEIVPEAYMIIMLFEDTAHGHLRTLHLNRPHPSKLGEGTWLGDSSAHWEGDTLVVDTVGFNDRTWLNEQGAQHSDALHLVERIRPILSDKYLEYKVTADDPKSLARPYTYTRYYQKVNSEIKEDICEDEQ